MKKSDLMSGMHVELSDGRFFVVIVGSDRKDGLYDYELRMVSPWEVVTEDLKILGTDLRIIAVYAATDKFGVIGDGLWRSKFTEIAEVLRRLADDIEKDMPDDIRLDFSREPRQRVDDGGYWVMSDYSDTTYKISFTSCES